MHLASAYVQHGLCMPTYIHTSIHEYKFVIFLCKYKVLSKCLFKSLNIKKNREDTTISISNSKKYT